MLLTPILIFLVEHHEEAESRRPLRQASVVDAAAEGHRRPQDREGGAAPDGERLEADQAR